jgi:hypothetical protein
LILLLLLKHTFSDTLLSLMLKVKEKSKRNRDDYDSVNNNISFYRQTINTKTSSTEDSINFGD